MRGARMDQLVLAVLFAASACEGARVSESTSNVVASNGDSLNGDSLNGDSLNGDSLNGDSLNGTLLNGDSLNGDSLNGDSLNGDSLNGMTLSGTLLSVTTSDGETYSGTALVGLIMTGYTVNGATVKVRVDAVSQGTGANSDVYYYLLSWKDGSRWRPVCVDARGKKQPEIPVLGRWNYGEGVPGGGSKTEDSSFVTWGCVISAIGKCVNLGYKPWKSMNGTSLSPYHQACTRLLRADYCGDGTPYTVDGNLVNLYDGLGVQLDTESWAFEAEWDTNGARCIAQTHRSPVPVPCASSKYSSSCGANGHFNNGTLLMSETP